MQIEEGKWYLDRTGELHGPAVRDTDPDDFYQWKLGRRFYSDDGRLLEEREDPRDLVSGVNHDYSPFRKWYRSITIEEAEKMPLVKALYENSMY